MKKTIEGFIEELRNDYIDLPSIITEENVNTPIKTQEGYFIWTILEIAIIRERTDAVRYLLTLGYNINPNVLAFVCKNNQILRLLFEAGVNVKEFPQILLNQDNHTIFFDYGGQLVRRYRYRWPHFYNYQLLVSFRVASSRKALAALIISCKRGFFPLRDVGVSLAKEMWVQRGPGGCGPRAYEWSKGKE